MTLVPGQNLNPMDRDSVVALQREFADLNVKVEAKRRELTDLTARHTDLLQLIGEEQARLDEMGLMTYAEMERQHQEKVDSYEQKIALLLQQEEQVKNSSAVAKDELVDLEKQIEQVQEKLKVKLLEFDQQINVADSKLVTVNREISDRQRFLSGVDDQINVAEKDLANTLEKDKAVKIAQATAQEVLDRKARDLAVWERRLMPAFEQKFGAENKMQFI